MKVNPDNKLEKLFERLRQDGWYCGWGLACCQSCAWDDVPFEHEVGPFKGKDIDFDKCLFNHEQDCQIDLYEEGEECDSCCGDGWNNETEDDCEICNGMGYVLSEEMQKELDIENRKYCAFPHYTYDEQKESTFCYSSDKNGVKNLKAILPIIEEMGCTYHWNGKGNSRISITWE
ncbi:hypothetical protein N9H77_01295 [Porticoccaceae bacterium]|nr:hypothetical protein [Porticoccaceae bacterium]MDB4559146.1 hypothetical protein [bacterium]